MHWKDYNFTGDPVCIDGDDCGHDDGDKGERVCWPGPWFGGDCNPEAPDEERKGCPGVDDNSNVTLACAVFTAEDANKTQIIQ